MVAAHVHRGRRPRVRRADPAAGRRAGWPAPTGCSTSAAARARWPAGRAPARGAELVVGVDPTSARSPRPPARRRRRATPGPAPTRCPSPTPRSTRSWPAWCSSTSTTSTRPSPRWPGCCAPGGRFVLLPQPPAAADARQRLDRRPDPRSARAVLAHRALPDRGRDRSSRSRRACSSAFVHRPLSRYVNAMADAGLAARADGRAGAAAGLPGPGRGVRRGRHASRACCTCVARRSRCDAEPARSSTAGRRERVHRDHRVVGGRAVAGGRHPRGPRLVRHRQPAARRSSPRCPSWPARPARASPRWCWWSAPGPYHDEVLPRPRSCCERQGARVRILFLEASTDVLVRRYESTRRRHPLADEPQPGRGHRGRAPRCSSR